VGRMFATVLTEENFDADYVLFNRAGGEVVEICGKKYTTKPLNVMTVTAQKFDFALFSAGAEVSKTYAEIFANNGAIVIDNSSAWRRDPAFPLVIPECNIDVAKEYVKKVKKDGRGGIIANPNCTTIGSLVALKPLDDAFKLKKVIYASYQAISGAGANPKFAYPIENNVIPYISGEEEKMVHETRKILGRDDIAVSATCIRVPVKNCHTVAIHAEFEQKPDMETVKRVMSNAMGLVLLPEGELPMPIIANGRNEVFAGRVRISDTFKNTICLVTASDNIRKGASTNAVQILKALI